MKEIKGNIWEYYEKGFWIVIPTNGFVKKNGEAVMGRGLALQAQYKFLELPKEIGDMLKDCDNHVFSFSEYRLLTFPVKDAWWKPATLELVEQSCKELKKIVHYNLGKIQVPVYLPRVGCGNGKLNWKDVKPILERFLDERFVVCDFR